MVHFGLDITDRKAAARIAMVHFGLDIRDRKAAARR